MNTPSSTRRLILQGSLLLAALLILYGRAATFQFVNYDDDLYVFSAQTRGWASLPLAELLLTPHLGYPIPAVAAVYWASIKLVGLGGAATLLHSINILVHLLNTALLWRLARRLCAADWVAWSVAALWALHPANVEAVCWVTSLKDLLCALGVLIAAQAITSPRRLLAPLLAAAGAALAFASKPGAVIVGPILLLAALLGGDIAALAQRKRVGLVGLVATLWAPVHIWIADRAHDQMIGERVIVPLFDRLSSTFVTQLESALVPINLRIFYIMEPAQGRDYLIFGAVFILTVALVGLLYQRKMSRPLFALLASIVAYAPYSNLLQGGRLIGNAYLYLPLAFLALFAVALSRDLSAPATPEDAPASERPLTIALLCMCLLLAPLTWQQVSTWRHSVALWSNARLFYPAEPFVHVKLGDALFAGQQYAIAVECFNIAYQNEMPVDYFPWRWPVSLWRMGYHDQAEQLFAWFLSQPFQRTQSSIAHRAEMVRFYGEFCAQTGRACRPLP